MLQRDLIIILPHLNLYISTSCAVILILQAVVLMLWWKFEQSMLTVLLLAAQTSTEHYSVPASEETTEQGIYWFIYCILLLAHRSKIRMQFISQLFPFTEITDCYCNWCVFNVNLCVNENLVYPRAVTAAFCPCASDVCTQKTVYQKFKLIWFKTHDIICGVFWAETSQTHLGTLETYITYCKKGHNMSPVSLIFSQLFLIIFF